MFTTVSETVEAFNDYLDESGYVFIDGLSFLPSRILKDLAPLAYKCRWLDWCDAEGIDTDELEDNYKFDQYK